MIIDFIKKYGDSKLNASIS